MKFEEGRTFYDEFPNRPTLINRWITRDNIVEIVLDTFPKCLDGVNGDVDVFSLDMDFWVCKSLYDDGFRPKIIIAEIQEIWKDDRCMTLEYQEGFWTNRPEESGCSLLVFQRLLGSDYKLGL